MNSLLAKHATGVDHMAIAVRDLETSIAWVTNSLGFVLKERRETRGTASAMISAVLEANGITVVLLQGTSPESQVSMFVEEYGPGVQHIALKVSDIETTVQDLKKAGVQFDTSIIGSGGLRQAFTRRDAGTGLMFELIERNGEGFNDTNVTELFKQLEEKASF